MIAGRLLALLIVVIVLTLVARGAGQRGVSGLCVLIGVCAFVLLVVQR